MCVCISSGSSEKQPIGCVCVCMYVEREQETERDIYFKELAHTNVDTGKSKICNAGQQAGDLRKS